MFEGLILTIGSLLFVILLCIVYFSKERFLSIRNKIYRYMIIVEIILLVTEIFASCFVYYEINNSLNLLIYRLHWFTGIIWFILLYYYSLILLDDIKANNIFEVIKMNLKNKIMFIFFVILSVVYFFIPFDTPDKNYISYIPGFAAYYVILYCSLIVGIILLITLRNKGKNTLRKKVSIIIMLIELVVTLLIQFSNPTISIYLIAFALQLFFMYFIIENPDLKIIKELETVKNEIEKSSKAKSDFLSNMSHEIRTPMNAIVGFSTGLLNSPNFDSKTAKDDIEHISAAGNNLLDIINNILDISKIESGAETLDLKEYSLKNIIMELSSIINARIGNRPIELIVDVDTNIPSVLYGDSTKIFQILLNILTNASKYTEVGKIKLSVTGNVVGDFVDLHFKISDTGYGIKKEDFDKLFSKFSRLDTATSNEIEGTGLGLVITKKYVDLMNGKIWFESEYQVGTSFYVDIKQKIINKTKLGLVNEPISTNKQINYNDYSGKKVLIVDDNKLNIKVAKRLLEPYNLDIDISESGKDCIYKVKMGTKYDIIFLDHMMPEMDGIEVLHILKKLEDYDLPPIVALTANAITGMKEMYLSEGFDEYLAKPINVSELNKILDKYLNK